MRLHMPEGAFQGIERMMFSGEWREGFTRGNE